MTVVTAHEARRHFAELLETAFYQNAQIRIHRNKKPMARLVGEPFMQAIEQLIATQPNLADTLAIMVDGDLMAAIEEGTVEVKAGKTIPIETVLEE